MTFLTGPLCAVTQRRMWRKRSWTSISELAHIILTWVHFTAVQVWKWGLLQYNEYICTYVCGQSYDQICISQVYLVVSSWRHSSLTGKLVPCHVNDFWTPHLHPLRAGLEGESVNSQWFSQPWLCKEALTKALERSLSLFCNLLLCWELPRLGNQNAFMRHQPQPPLNKGTLPYVSSYLAVNCYPLFNWWTCFSWVLWAALAN